MNKSLRSKIKGMVLFTLNTCDRVEFPVNIKYICRHQPGVRLIPYSKQMQKYNLSYSEMLEQAETEDAFTIYDAKKDKYLIFYNDLDQEIMGTNRYRWNIAHELGHVMLGHHKRSKKTKIFRNSLSKNEYNALEDEADYFASYILVPYSVLHYANPTSPSQLRNICKISNKAAKIRYKEFLIWRSKNPKALYDSMVRKIFAKDCFKKFCNNCGSSIITKKNISFCPICGKEELKWGNGTMIYKKYDTHEDINKVKICLNCDNEETNIAGDFCQICGKPLVNKCDDRGWDNYPSDDGRPCGKPVPSNARYCPYCGGKTTFLNDGVLEEWEVERKEQEAEDELNNKMDRYMNIPDGLDEELPFN